MFFPRDWYWTADDGRVFSSLRFKIVDKADGDFEAWRAAGHLPTVWPRDDAGQQTDATLDAVLRDHKLSTAGAVSTAYGDDLLSALSDAELAAMSGGTMRDQRMLSAQRAPFVPTDDIIVRLAAVMKIDPAAWFARLTG